LNAILADLEISKPVGEKFPRTGRTVILGGFGNQQTNGRQIFSNGVNRYFGRIWKSANQCGANFLERSRTEV
ncbi:MAG: hypothetical protein IKR17_03900, partial [Bacteroidales bacterium]|nr:hypothetical protein [Bacteroidales bacterium]